MAHAMTIQGLALLLLSLAGVTLGASVIRVHSNGNVENMATASVTGHKNNVAHNLLDEVEAMIKKGRKVDPEKIESIRAIVDDNLVPTLQATHQNRQNQVNQNILAIQKCNTDVLSTLSDIETNTEASVETFRKDHIACRSNESQIIADKNAKCKLLTDFVQAIYVPATLPNKSDEAAVVDYVQTMASFFCPKEQEGIDKEQACTDARAAAAQKSSKCFGMQETFEAGFCTWRTRLLDTCGTHTSCYDAAKTHYEQFKSETEDLVTKWKTEFTALKKISCFVEVWLSDHNAATADAGKLEECENLSPDDSEMDIDYGTVPDKAVCSLEKVEVYPGDTGFPGREYAEYLEQIGNITACLK